VPVAVLAVQSAVWRVDLLADPQDGLLAQVAPLVVRSGAWRADLRDDPQDDSAAAHLAASPGDPQGAHWESAYCLVVHSAAQLAVHSDASRADLLAGQQDDCLAVR
jgi:hypothetical protein